MSKPISRPLHGILDYSYAAAIASSPHLVGFSQDAPATLLMRVLGGAVLLTSLCTRYELGLIRVLPFKLHLGADALAGVFSLAAPWLFKFSGDERARNTFLAFGVLALVVASLTRAEEMPS